MANEIEDIFTADTEVKIDLSEALKTTEDNDNPEAGFDPEKPENPKDSSEGDVKKNKQIELPDDLTTLLNESGQSEPGASDTSDGNNPFEVVAQEYVSAGALSPEDVETVTKDVSSMSEFIQRVEERRKDSRVDKLTEDQKKYLDAVESGYDPTQFLNEKERRDQFKSISDEQISKQDEKLDNARKAVVVEYLTVAKNYSKDDAEALASSYNGEKLIEKAKEGRDGLVDHYETKWQNKIQESQQTKEQQKQQELDKVNQVVDTIKKQEKIFGYKITDPLREKMTEYATKNYGSDDKPQNFIQKQLEEDFIGTTNKLAFILAMTNGLTDMKPLMSKSATKASEALRKIVEGDEKKGATGGNSTTQDKSSVSSDYFKNNLEGIEEALNAF